MTHTKNNNLKNGGKLEKNSTKTTKTAKKAVGRPAGKMDDKAKYVRDCRDGVRKLKKIVDAHMPQALENLDAAKVVTQIIKTTHDINTSLIKDTEIKDPQVAIQVNNNNVTTDEVIEILKKKHKDL